MHAEPATDNSDCSYGVRPLRSPSILLQMLLRDRQTATVADALQAVRWRDWLVDERSRLALELSKQESQYQRCAALVADRRGRYLRHSIRSLENEIRTVDYMLDALGRRFMGEIPTRR